MPLYCEALNPICMAFDISSIPDCTLYLSLINIDVKEKIRREKERNKRETERERNKIEKGKKTATS